MAFALLSKLSCKGKQFPSEELTNHSENRSFFRTALAWKGSVTPKIFSRVVWSGFYASVVVLVGKYFPMLHLSITPFEYSGAVLGLLLVARVNAGVDRWWEARKIWGNIVNQSRNLAIVTHQYSASSSMLSSVFLRWVALWPYAMKEQLRGEKNLIEGDRLLGLKNLNSVKASSHMPMYIGARIATLLKEMRKNNIDDFTFHRAERERSLLIDAIGACERIKSTPIPLVLAIKTRRFILLFLVLLPFGLFGKVDWMTPFIVMLTAYPLFCLDEIGVELQNPFSKANLSHLPLDTICNNIESNVLSLEKVECDVDDIGNADSLLLNKMGTSSSLAFVGEVSHRA